MLTSRFYDSRMLIFQGFEWSFMTLAYITVACRIYVRLVMRKARLFSADYWLILGLLSCQGLLICDTITYSMDAMDDFTIDNVAIRKVGMQCKYETDVSSRQLSCILISSFHFDLIRNKSFLRNRHILSQIQHH